MRALGITSARRSKVVPQLPTIAEQGVAGYDFGAWFGIYAPAATPAPVINTLNDSITRAVRDPGLAERFDKEGAEIVGSSPAVLAAHVKAELALWAKVVKSAGLRID
jgi:tripartite-type tricarboxylate transporter receptor subunit TctC